MKLSQETDMTDGKQPNSPRARAAGAVLGAVLPCLAAAVARAGELTIEVSGITPNRGQVYVALYDRAETFPMAGQQRVSQMLAPEDQHLTVHFKDLPPGQYAAAAFQDFNGNGKLDKNLFGIPKEPYGFSNSARGSSGPPKFDAAAITLNPDGTTTIVLK
jgi:uncharacterized protein (DUF2141 family)